ncbi:hypothetical protein HZP65_01255 [Elizabethkingia anophelis]|nr:hypothetical protein [Elizabethkingia anophelis]MCT4275592.1 hypothetical protein [Elizabethkingia anophelis]MCT4278378.1 hypothetical protein [Elizabethkingia anophelis]
MKEFVELLLKYKMNFDIIDIPYKDIHLIQKKVLSKLKLNNLNELRDRFEGMDFYERTLQRCLPILALEKKIKRQIIDWVNVDIDDIKQVIDIDGRMVSTNIVKYGHLPLFDIDNSLPTIFFVHNDKKEVWICGFASSDTLQKFKGKEKKVGIGSMAKYQAEFIGFSHLLRINSYEELQIMLKQN